MTPDDKLLIAKQLELLKVDIIEAGFPAAGSNEFRAVEMISSEIKDCAVMAMSRAVESDVTAAGESLRHALSPMIHTSIATSTIHREYKLKMSREEVIQKAVSAVRCAKQFTPQVEFGAEDAARTEPEYLCEVYQKVIDAGALIINIPDTVGHSTPEEFSKLVNFIHQNIILHNPHVRLSIHCHNDLGLATANTLAGINAGANQAEVTLCGIGERSGNAALEEIVMNLKLHPGVKYTDINPRSIYHASRLLYSILGMPPPINKAVIGQNSFSHTSGIHQHGLLANPETYQIFEGESIGSPDYQLPFGIYSGKSGLAEKMKSLTGIQFPDDLIHLLLMDIKQYFQNHFSLNDTRLLILSQKYLKIKIVPYQIKKMELFFNKKYIANIEFISPKDQAIIPVSGNGRSPFEAIKRAYCSYFKFEWNLLEFSINTSGIENKLTGKVILKMICNKIIYHSEGIGLDSYFVFAEALLDSINQIIIKEKPDGYPIFHSGSTTG